MHDAGREDDRQRRRAQRAHQRPQPADAARLAFRREVRETEIVVGERLRANQRQPVPGRTGDEIERPRAMRRVEHVEDRARIAKRVGRRQRSIEEHRAIVEPADVDAECAGIDADDARHELELNRT